MTKDVTTSLRELVEKARPGDWSDGKDVHLRGCHDVGLSICFVNCEPGSKTDTEARANTALIVAMKRALPGLLDEVEGLRSQVDELLALQAEDDASFRNTEARALSAEGEVAELRSGLQGLAPLLDGLSAELRREAADLVGGQRNRALAEASEFEGWARFLDAHLPARLSIGKGNGEGLPEGKQPPQSGPGAVAPATFEQVKP